MSPAEQYLTNYVRETFPHHKVTFTSAPGFYHNMVRVEVIYARVTASRTFELKMDIKIIGLGGKVY